MKKITLLFITLLAFSFTDAQTTVFSDDFNDEDISDWTLSDEDGDGVNWGAVQITDGMGNPVDTPLLRSASWNGAPLFPNNWIISPVIDLSGASGVISLDWQVKASDAAYDIEQYTVYVGTSDVVADLLTSTTTFNEPSLDGVNTLTDRTLDISSFAGDATVYVAFRHHDVSDQFTMEIDNVSVSAETLSVSESELSRFEHRYNSNIDILTLESSGLPFDNVQVYNLLGKEVINKKLSQANELVNMSNLSEGVYLVKVSIQGQTKTIKVIKN